jgi:hypothetical protein
LAVAGQQHWAITVIRAHRDFLLFQWLNGCSEKHFQSVAFPTQNGSAPMGPGNSLIGRLKGFEFGDQPIP